MPTSSSYPPRHEIVGIVVDVGSEVQKFKAGVGVFVRSCLDCKFCNCKDELWCPKAVYTYGTEDTDGSIAQGGYSSHIVIHEQ
jgi:D-arabinose 1-dehydrogenase-like Zn-dependent alcohol dehydrogenase